MHYVLKPLNLVFPLLFLAACSSGPYQEVQTDTSFSEVVSLKIGLQTDRATLEAMHGGEVIVWRPEDNLAIVGLYGSELSVQGVKDAFKTPEASTLTAYNNGYRAWGGGYRAWGGGYRAWGGGSTAYPTTFTENAGLWNQIRLNLGQSIATKLGSGVKVAVIDTGIDLAHSAFVGKLAPAAEWKDFVDGDAYPQEVAGGLGYGHGTAVAGVVLQVAPNATILPIRVLEPDGTGDLDKVVLAVDWAIKQGAKVINLSLGSDVDYAALKNMTLLAASKGISIVASVGNNGIKGVEYPAAYKSGAFAIGSVDSQNVQSVFSSYGPELNVLAPGEYVYSAYPQEQVAYGSGTSFAAPVVSGTYALTLGESAVSRADLQNALTKSSISLAANPRGLLQVDVFLRTALNR